MKPSAVLQGTHEAAGTGHRRPPLFGVRRRLKRPALIGAERMIHEEHPGAVRQATVDLHAVVMHLGRLAVLVGALDQPRERVIAKAPATVV